ncbi:hypothetical protein CHARACLAT_029205 [Characodon lateralis]|uniref:Uncharacterized protein n=1 Tax=Characodon lateralis TaxID=208331 RepID=A0ABU7F7D6_9TELE|nr:hypothetical protein [Characodon lateralis]
MSPSPFKLGLELITKKELNSFSTLERRQQLHRPDHSERSDRFQPAGTNKKRFFLYLFISQERMLTISAFTCITSDRLANKLDTLLSTCYCCDL